MKTYTGSYVTEIYAEERDGTIYTPRKFSRCLKNWDSEIKANTLRGRNTVRNVFVLTSILEVDWIGSHCISFRSTRKVIATIELTSESYRDLPNRFCFKLILRSPVSFRFSFPLVENRLRATIEIFACLFEWNKHSLFPPRNIYIPRSLSWHF